MKDSLYAFVAFLCLYTGSVFAQDGGYPPIGEPPVVSEQQSPVPEPSDPNARIVSEQEFYFYDDNKMRIPLILSRKAVVRFFAEKPGEGKAAYLKRYAPVELESIFSVYPRAEYALGYLPTIDTMTMVRTIKKLSADQELEVAPVFVVDGMEAVVDGVYLETVTPMSRDAVSAALKKVFGNDAMIHEITPEGSVWHISFKRLFFLNDKRLPLHVLSLANFLERSTKLFWVKRAYPKFAFLRDPVVATLAVFPATGTVGEERVATLSIRMFGKTAADVVIDENSIPEFMQGKFVPLAGGNPPQAAFRDEARKPPVKGLRKQVGPNEWSIEHQYTFGLYAPEPEWVISGLSILYEYKKAKKIAMVPPVTFFVRAHLDEKFALSDIPEAYLMPALGFSGIAPAIPAAKNEWFDPLAQVLGGRERLSLSLLSIASVAALVALSLGVVLIMRHRANIRSLRPLHHVWSTEELRDVLRGSETIEDQEDAYRLLHNALSLVLHQRFPEIPERNATFQHVKELAGGLCAIFPEDTERSLDLEELFEDLEQRHAPGFLDNSADQLRVHRASISARIVALREILYRSEGGGG